MLSHPLGRLGPLGFDGGLAAGDPDQLVGSALLKVGTELLQEFWKGRAGPLACFD